MAELDAGRIRSEHLPYDPLPQPARSKNVHLVGRNNRQRWILCPRERDDNSRDALHLDARILPDVGGEVLLLDLAAEGGAAAVFSRKHEVDGGNFGGRAPEDAEIAEGF